jgi:hypothetical protein
MNQTKIKQAKKLIAGSAFCLAVGTGAGIECVKLLRSEDAHYAMIANSNLTQSTIPIRKSEDDTEKSDARDRLMLGFVVVAPLATGLTGVVLLAIEEAIHPMVM